MPGTWDSGSLSPQEALQRLVDGNRRFLEPGASLVDRSFRSELAHQSQRPFAVVLGCSDSRTPVEILFDVGFGDLFVVRIAGQVVAPSGVGSIEFAVSEFGTRLVVVLGHTRCGAISATVRELHSGEGSQSKNLRAITDRISPHIEGFVRSQKPSMEPELLRESMRINVRASADHLRHGSRMLEDLVMDGQIAIVGAEYELETGQVNFFHGLPLAPSR